MEEACSQGCQVNSSGIDDACIASAPSGSCAGFNDGLYCGSDYVNGDPSTLYQCSGGSISVAEVCPNSCQVNADGTNDACQ